MTLDPRPSDAELAALAERRVKKSSRMTGLRPSIRVSTEPPPTLIVIPLKYCISDNRKYYATVRRTKSGQFKARLFLSPEYREGKEGARRFAILCMKNQAPFRGPVRWTATVHFENNRRDLQNSCKLLSDALKGVVYEDDKQIKRAEWIWGEADKDNPRIEIVVAALDAE